METPIVKNTVDARAGVTGHSVHYVLAISLTSDAETLSGKMEKHSTHITF